MKIWLLRIAPGAVLILAVAWMVHFLLFTHTGIHLTHTNVNQFSAYLHSLGPLSYVIGIGAILLQTSFFPFVPFVFIAGANVLAFGLWEGFVINYLTACLGAILSFLFARYIGRSWVERKLAQYPLTSEFNRRMESHGFFYVFLGRLIPIIPSSAINFGAGVTKVKFLHFFLGTVIGKLPIIILESLVGHDLMRIRKYKKRLLAILLVFVLLMLIGIRLKKKLFAGNQEPH